MLKKTVIYNKLKASYFYVLGSLLNTSNVTHFVFFLGNGRSGTTLTRFVLNAHPEVFISNELSIFNLIKKGQNKKMVFGQICKNIQKFNKNGFWKGYNFSLEYSTKNKPWKIIGDKKSYASVLHLKNNPQLLNELEQTIQLPFKVFHCIRNPYDAITSHAKLLNIGLDESINLYFNVEKYVANWNENNGQIFKIYHEKLLEHPEKVLKDMFHFLNLKCPNPLIDACKKKFFKTARQSRNEIKWSAEQILNVQLQASKIEHFDYYFKRGLMTY